MTLGEAHRKSHPHHSNDMIRRHIGAKDRAGHSPPSGTFPGQEIVFRVFLLSSGPKPKSHYYKKGAKEYD